MADGYFPRLRCRLGFHRFSGHQWVLSGHPIDMGSDELDRFTGRVVVDSCIHCSIVKAWPWSGSYTIPAADTTGEDSSRFDENAQRRSEQHEMETTHA